MDNPKKVISEEATEATKLEHQAIEPEVVDPEDTQLQTSEQDGEMPILEHLEELRTRLIYALCAVVVGSGVAYYFLDEIMAILIAPAGKLYYMQPAEAFFNYVKITIFAGFFIALPVVFYQLWRFFLPALTTKERILLTILLPVSVGLFYGGAAFSFEFVWPVCMKFFLGMGTDYMTPMFSLGRYLELLISFVLIFAIVFELPLVMLLMAQLGLVTSSFLQKQFRVVILLTLIIGAMLTPPDVFSQVMVALPMIILYGISLLIIKYIMRK